MVSPSSPPNPRLDYQSPLPAMPKPPGPLRIVLATSLSILTFAAALIVISLWFNSEGVPSIMYVVVPVFSLVLAVGVFAFVTDGSPLPPDQSRDREGAEE